MFVTTKSSVCWVWQALVSSCEFIACHLLFCSDHQCCSEIPPAWDNCWMPSVFFFPFSANESSCIQIWNSHHLGFFGENSLVAHAMLLNGYEFDSGCSWFVNDCLVMQIGSFWWVIFLHYVKNATSWWGKVPHEFKNYSSNLSFRSFGEIIAGISQIDQTSFAGLF